MGSSLKTAQFPFDSRLADAARGDADACYDLGMVYSSGSAGVGVDLIEAHKWFNLAAVAGSEAAKSAVAANSCNGFQFMFPPNCLLELICNCSYAN